MKDEIMKLASECLDDNEVKEAFRIAFTKAITSSIDNAFKWGEVNKAIDSKIKEVMLPYIESYDFSKYLIKLDTVLTDILKSDNITANKEIIKNFEKLTKNDIPHEITATQIFEKWMEWAADDINTSELEVDTDDDPTYEWQDCYYKFRENNKENWFSSVRKGYLHFSCDSDDDLTVSLPVKRWGNDGYWTIDIDSSEINIESLRRLDSFKIFVLQMKQNFTHIIIDKEEDEDQFQPTETPEPRF